MDRAGRNFLSLTAVGLIVSAYGVCALVAYGVLPLVEGTNPGSGAALLTVGGLVALLTLSVALAGRTIWQEVTAGRALSRRIDEVALPVPPKLHTAALHAGVAGRTVLIDSRTSCSFVIGALAPRVALSSRLLSRLTPAELRAVLEHEHYHVLSLDPLRATMAQAVVDALFFLPALRALHHRYEAARELAADRRAISLVGREPLAAALLKAMEEAPAAGPARIALTAAGTMDARLSQLETGREPRPAAVDRRSLGASVAGALLFLALIAGIPLAIGGAADLSRELGPASLLEGGILCLAPLVAMAMLGYGGLRRRPVRRPAPAPAARSPRA